jgi:hypothetical protein
MKIKKKIEINERDLIFEIERKLILKQIMIVH